MRRLPNYLKCIAKFILGWSCIAITASAHAETVELVADEWCPYNCSPGDELPGILIEIASRAFSPHGIAVDYKVLPYTRAIEEVRVGRYAGVLGAIADEVPNFVLPARWQIPLFSDLYVKSTSDWRYRGISSLESVSLGVVQDYSYGFELDRYIAANKGNRSRLQITTGDGAAVTNLRKLLAERVAVIAEDRAVVASALKSFGDLNDVRREATLFVSKGYIAFSPVRGDSKRLAKLLSDETQRLEDSGELGKIYAKYGVEYEPLINAPAASPDSAS